MQEVIQTNQDEKKALRNIAANVLRLLAEKDWSQSELSRRSGEMPMTISRMVHAQHMPTFPVMMNVAEALGVTAESLIADPPKKSRQSA